MLEKIRSFWLALWAGFLRFMYLDQPRKDATVPKKYSLKDLQEMMTSPAGRQIMTDWVEVNLRPLENDEEYLRLVKLGGAPFNGDILTRLIAKFDTFVVAGSRGHGVGHHKRDLAHAYALAADSFKNPNIFPAEALAGYIAGGWHEFAAGYTIRYHDKNYALGHAEAGAFGLYHALLEFFPEHICLLVAYAVAAHTHFTADFISVDGSPRKVWKDTIFQADGHWIRLAVWLCRMADRVDNLGVAQIARTIESWADMVIFGGADLRPDGSWNAMDENGLKTLLTPDFKNAAGGPTTFTHILGYAASAIALKPLYNIHDHFFPNMDLLKARKLEEVVLLANSLSIKSTTNPGLNRLVSFLDRVEMSTMTGTKQEALISSAWTSLSEAEQIKWSSILDTAEICYTRWLELLLQTVSRKNIFPGFDNEVFFAKYLK